MQQMIPFLLILPTFLLQSPVEKVVGNIQSVVHVAITN